MIGHTENGRQRRINTLRFVKAKTLGNTALVFSLLPHETITNLDCWMILRLREQIVCNLLSGPSACAYCDRTISMKKQPQHLVFLDSASDQTCAQAH